MMDNKEKIQRMANPKKPSDYQLSITYSSKEEADELFRQIEEARLENDGKSLDEAIHKALKLND